MKKDNLNLKVKDGREKDIDGILSLRKVVFGEFEKDKLASEFWRWEFMDNPDGNGLIYIVEDNGRIIGHLADIPRRFYVYGEIVLGTVSVDLMVAPEYRRRGIFEKMGRYAIQRVKEKNRTFMSSFPIRPQTINGFKKIGWIEILKLPVLIYPVRFSGILNNYLRLTPLSIFLAGVLRIFYDAIFSFKERKQDKSVEIKEIKGIDQEFENFLNKHISIFPIIGVRDKNYMNWRYISHPTRFYTIYQAVKNGEIKGYIILRKADLLGFNTAVIVDLLTTEIDLLYALIDKGISYGKRENVDMLCFMVPKDHYYYKIFKKYGFIRSPKSFRFMIYPQEDKKELFDPKNWYLTWGDTDVM